VDPFISIFLCRWNSKQLPTTIWLNCLHSKALSLALIAESGKVVFIRNIMSYRFHLSYECQILLALLSRRQVRWEHSTVHDTYLLISNSESCSGRCPIQTSHLRFTIMLLRNFSFIELLPLASSPAFTLRLIFSCACICRDVANSVVNDADQRCTSRYRSAEMSR